VVDDIAGCRVFDEFSSEFHYITDPSQATT